MLKAAIFMAASLITDFVYKRQIYDKLKLLTLPWFTTAEWLHFTACRIIRPKTCLGIAFL